MSTTTPRPLNYPDLVQSKDMSINLLWALFAQAVLPLNASPLQQDEMRKAFFAGFIECFKVVTDYATALPEDDAAELLSRLNTEATEFVEKVLAESKR